MRVFLDSNVIFSGIYSPAGAPGTILHLFVRGELAVVVSQQFITEAITALQDADPKAVSKFTSLLMANPLEVIPAPTLEQVRAFTKVIHLEDATILAAAANSAPDYFITGDKDFFRNPEIATESGLRIVTPGEFLAILDRSNR
ncbi:MAG: putative toxin-antitoxin system toxin component, PIN family [Chloroflexi bacterium]|nr:putative toxin-antitoxin system toxin component, PIN family [Chloroflexota bacterium]